MKSTLIHFQDHEWRRLHRAATELDVSVADILHQLADRYIATLEWELAHRKAPDSPRIGLVGATTAPTANSAPAASLPPLRGRHETV